MIKRVSIFGPGLLGGSIALAIRKKCPSLELVLWGRREQPLSLARSLGVTETTTEIAKAVDSSDLCILATPVGVMAGVAEKIVKCAGGRALMITDVGSVKRLPHSQMQPLIEGSNVEYIGSHPMAGSERAGMEAARVELLDGATCLITNDGGCASERVELLARFWQSLGCRTRMMTAEDHDYAVARVSHFPHILAAVGATIGLEFEDIIELCGGGMRDTTRVAAGDPDLWTEILLENSDALHRSMRESIGDMVKLMDVLEKNDRDSLHRYLTEAKRRRGLVGNT